jgi:hypothetical protein
VLDLPFAHDRERHVRELDEVAARADGADLGMRGQTSASSIATSVSTTARRTPDRPCASVSARTASVARTTSRGCEGPRPLAWLRTRFAWNAGPRRAAPGARRAARSRCSRRTRGARTPAGGGTARRLRRRAARPTRLPERGPRPPRARRRRAPAAPAAPERSPLPPARRYPTVGIAANVARARFCTRKPHERALNAPGLLIPPRKCVEPPSRAPRARF